MLLLFAVGMGLGGVGVAFGQISQGGTPPSFALATSSTVPGVQMPAVDVTAYLAEDAQAPKDEAYRFAATIDVALSLQNSGRWDEVPGGRIWRLRISSPGAYSLCLIYDQWFLPEGGQLFIYNSDTSQVIGAFTSFNNWVDGTNVTQHVAGDEIVVEYYEPAEVYGQGVLFISQVAHAYRNLFGHADATDNYGDSGSCNNNVNCPEGAPWQTNKRGVAMIMSGGSRICTGSMINNVRQDRTPYFLTANHCLGGSNTWVFVFNYESPGCPNVNGPTNQTVANSTLRASYSASDFALLQLSAIPPASYNPYYNGWNRVDAAATNSVCIHHPSGDIKKITFDNNAPVSSTWSGTPANSHWRILNWEDGTTEPGSSGSPLFDQNHRITGQLHGGTASCSNNIDDYFGKFSMSWAQGSSASTRLRDWLDPDNTGVTTLDGMEGGGPSITVTSPNGGETWITGETGTITWTSSGLSENVRIEINRTYPSTSWVDIIASTPNDGSHAWTVTTPVTTTARIRISGAVTTTVKDTSNANFTIATRSLALTVPNGGENWVEGTTQNITWSSSNLTGLVNLEINRNYPAGVWESLVANTADDGLHPWLVTVPATGSARMRVTSASYPTVGDSSNANFTVSARTVTVIAPNGGESWVVGSLQNLRWSSENIVGTVNVELNRTYPTGAWEPLAMNTANDGVEPWTVALPVSTSARVRVTSVTYPAVSDISNSNFSIVPPDQAPVIVHNPLDDQGIGTFAVTAWVYDEAPGVTARFFYRLVGTSAYDSLTMAATGYLNEYAATAGTLAPGRYEYYLRARDAGGQFAVTGNFLFEVGPSCGAELAYDDGSGEASHWTVEPGFKWAVRFDPAAVPFALCTGRIGVSALNPDSSHAALLVEVFAGDGVSGMPGTLLLSKYIGSIGNVIGGVPSGTSNWADVVFRDLGGNPLTVNGSFYIAVSNPVADIFEAFLQDQSASYAGHSYVYDACEEVWLNESTQHASTRLGNRLIRASGFSLVPPQVVVSRVGNDIQLNWVATGAPYYNVYSAATASGPFTALLGTTSVTSFTDPNPGALVKFYQVRAATNP